MVPRVWVVCSGGVMDLMDLMDLMDYGPPGKEATAMDHGNGPPGKEATAMDHGDGPWRWTVGSVTSLGSDSRVQLSRQVHPVHPVHAVQPSIEAEGGGVGGAEGVGGVLGWCDGPYGPYGPYGLWTTGERGDGNGRWGGALLQVCSCLGHYGICHGAGFAEVSAGVDDGLQALAGVVLGHCGMC